MCLMFVILDDAASESTYATSFNSYRTSTEESFDWIYCLYMLWAMTYSNLEFPQGSLLQPA